MFKWVFVNCLNVSVLRKEIHFKMPFIKNLEKNWKRKQNLDFIYQMVNFANPH